MFLVDFIYNTKYIANNYEELVVKYLDNIYKNVKKKHKNFKFILPLLKYLKKNSTVFFIMFIAFILFCSYSIISILFYFLLFNSLVLSLLVLHNTNIKVNSRKLSKNVISFGIVSLNPFGTLITLILVFFLYNDSNKFINSLIIKIIDKLFHFITNSLPFLSYVYPKITEIDYDTEINISNDSSSGLTSYEASSFKNKKIIDITNNKKNLKKLKKNYSDININTDNSLQS